ncbi:MAG TPA: LPXTG cell wall anchor domain-containing protein [Candidatus Nitrosocosmicus sp.]|nr:LPXTG cell wall anchor domain-containing protein [Candidatus Nitrosocosmicus sp.]
MEGLNKIISLFLGLVVVIILFSIITGRFAPFKEKTLFSKKVGTTTTPTPSPTPKKENKKFLGIFGGDKKPTATPTPTSKPKTTVIDTTKEVGSTYNPNIKGGVVTTNTPTPISKMGTTTNTGSVKTIPATGSPTALLPFLGTALLAGIYLRKRK